MRAVLRTGRCYLPLKGEFHDRLVKELKAAGYDTDADALALVRQDVFAADAQEVVAGGLDVLRQGLLAAIIHCAISGNVKKVRQAFLTSRESVARNLEHLLDADPVRLQELKILTNHYGGVFAAVETQWAGKHNTNRSVQHARRTAARKAEGVPDPEWEDTHQSFAENLLKMAYSLQLLIGRIEALFPGDGELNLLSASVFNCSLYFIALVNQMTRPGELAGCELPEHAMKASSSRYVFGIDNGDAVVRTNVRKNMAASAQNVKLPRETVPLFTTHLQRARPRLIRRLQEGPPGRENLVKYTGDHGGLFTAPNGQALARHLDVMQDGVTRRPKTSQKTNRGEEMLVALHDICVALLGYKAGRTPLMNICNLTGVRSTLISSHNVKGGTCDLVYRGLKETGSLNSLVGDAVPQAHADAINFHVRTTAATREGNVDFSYNQNIQPSTEIVRRGLQGVMPTLRREVEEANPDREPGKVGAWFLSDDELREALCKDRLDVRYRKSLREPKPKKVRADDAPEGP